MSRIDYSVWDHIEVSDDEDDTHPNIDTPSLFRWRHRARMERMEAAQQKRTQFDMKKNKHKSDLAAARKALEEAQRTQSHSVLKLKEVLQKLLEEDECIRKEEAELNAEEKKMPWNVDTLSKPGFEKSSIQQEKPKPTSDNPERNMKDFLSSYKSDIKHFGILQSYPESEAYLLKNPHLACEEAANYLCLWCIDLAVEEKNALMDRVSHQTVCLQFLLELAKQLKVDPRDVIRAYFKKMALNDKEYMDGFNSELSMFRSRARDRAQVRIAEALKEYEREEREKRLGPGGLDPLEVFETLPLKLRECFDKKDPELLKEVLASMPEKDACYHLKRCIDSGLWIPDANTKPVCGEADHVPDIGNQDHHIKK